MKNSNDPKEAPPVMPSPIMTRELTEMPVFDLSTLPMLQTVEEDAPQNTPAVTFPKK